MHAPIVILRHAVVSVPDADEPTATLRLANNANQALQVELPILAAQANAGHLHRQVIPGNRRDVPLPVHLIDDGVDILPCDVISEFGPGMSQGAAQTVFFTMATRFFRCLRARPIIRFISGAFFPGQSGPLRLFRQCQPTQFLTQVTCRGGIPARIGRGIPELRAVESGFDYLEALCFLDQPNRNQAVDLKARIRLMGRQGKPLVIALIGQDEPDRRKQLQVILPLRETGSAQKRCLGSGNGVKDSSALEVRRLDSQSTDDACNADLSATATEDRGQEFAAEKLLLGRREAIQGIGHVLRFSHEERNRRRLQVRGASWNHFRRCTL